MKKIGILIVILAILLGVVGCGGGTTPASSATPTATSTPSPAATTAPAPKPTATTTPAAPVIKLKVQSWGGATHPGRLMVEDIIKALEASGRFKVDYFPAEAMMKSKDAWDGMRQGVLDMAISPAGYQIDRMGIVGEIEWFPRNFDFDKFVAHYRDAGGLMDFSQPYFKKQGLILLSDLRTPQNVMSSRKAVGSLEDIKGKLARDAGGQAPYLKLLGATPVAVAASETYGAFQRGTIDMFINGSLEGYASNKWNEVAPFVGMIEFGLGGLQLTMSEKVYNSFPADAKAIFDKAVLDNEKTMFAAGKKGYDALVTQLKANKVTFWYPTKDELARWDTAMKPYVDSMGQKYGAEWVALDKIRSTLR